jgi:YVTN family beta-propeller protein
MSFFRKNLIVILVLCLTIAGAGQVFVIDTIDVGYNTAGIAVNPATNQVYVSNEYWITKIDGMSDAVIDTILGVSGVNDLDVDSGRNLIYAASISDSIVYVIDGGTDSIIADIKVGYYPYGIGVNQVTNKIYVAQTYSDNVFVIDGSTNSVTDTISDINHPLAVAVNSANNRIYTSSLDGFSVSVIDGTADTIITSFFASMPGMIGVEPVTNRIYVPEQFRDDILVIDGAENTIIDTVEVGDLPVAAGVNPETNRIYVTIYNEDSVSIIDGSTFSVASTIGVGVSPRNVCVNPETHKIYVCCYSEGTVWVLEDLTGGVEDPSTDPSPLNFSISPNPFSGRTEFVLNVPNGAEEVSFSIYNVSGILVKSFSLGKGPTSPIALRWDGVGDNGKKCASGVYIGVLKAGDNKPSQGKILLIN